MTAGDGEMGDHLTEGDHDRITERTDSGVTDKETSGTTVTESVGGTYRGRRSDQLGDRLRGDVQGESVEVARTEEETSSDNTPDRNHLDMASFTVCSRVCEDAAQETREAAATHRPRCRDSPAVAEPSMSPCWRITTSLPFSTSVLEKVS